MIVGQAVCLPVRWRCLTVRVIGFKFHIIDPAIFCCFKKILASYNLTTRASLAPRDTLFFYTIFTQGQNEARVLQALCKS